MLGHPIFTLVGFLVVAATAAAAPGTGGPAVAAPSRTMTTGAPAPARNEPYQPRLILTTKNIDTDELRMKFAAMLGLANQALGTASSENDDVVPTIVFVTTAMQVPCAGHEWHRAATDGSMRRPSSPSEPPGCTPCAAPPASTLRAIADAVRARSADHQIGGV